MLNWHWSKQRRWGRAWDNEVMVAKNRQKIFGRPRYGNVRIVITVLFCGRVEMDPDNLVASAKPVIDALVDNGLIYDDTPEHVRGITVVESRVPRMQTGTMVVIRPSNQQP